MEIRKAVMQTTSRAVRKPQIKVDSGLVEVVELDFRSQCAFFRRSMLKDSASRPGGDSSRSFPKSKEDLTLKKEDMAALNATQSFLVSKEPTLSSPKIADTKIRSQGARFVK